MQQTNKKKIYIIAGEASGDLHGAGLMRAMKKIDSSITFYGIGGPKMMKEGLSSLIPLSQLAVMGFWEVLKKIRFFLNLEKTVIKQIGNVQPSHIIMVDYPGFNLRIAKKIKQNHQIPIHYYISPQLWAWKEKRVEIIKKYIDSMIVVFPFEQEWYKKRGVQTHYFGHPIIDHSKQYNYTATPINNEINIAICPGSRIQEIKRHMPVLSKVIEKYPKTKKQKINFTIIKAPGISNQELQKYIKNQEVNITNESILSVFEKTHIGIVASGTASLECSITKKPIIVIYKMSWISWFITKRFIKIPFACISNILANKQIIPELLQSKLTVNNVITELNKSLSLSNQNKYVEQINKIVASLGNGLTYEKTANFILNNN